MNPDKGEDAEDWFARFEREARESAQQRDAEAAPQPPVAPPAEPVVPPTATPLPPAPLPPAAPVGPPPVTPQLANPFDAPPATPLQPPAPLWEPDATQAMEVREPDATQAMPVYPDPTQATPPHTEPTVALPTADAEPTQALERAPLRPPGDDGSALDSLFGDDRFREYESALGPDPSNAPFVNRSRSKELVRVEGGGDGAPPPPRQFGTPQKILAGVGGGLLAILALIALFLLGTRLPDLLGPAPAVSTPTPTPTPTLTALPIGPVEPGEYAWDELLGGECLEPFDNAWQEDFTVVPCDEPHGGQLVDRAWFPPEVVDPENPQVGKPDDPFPGVQELQTRMTLLCSAPGVVNLAAAGAFGDAQMQGAYPVTEEQWDADPSYYCFFSRSSGEPMTVDVAIPRVAPVP
jgi:hypothetical protein